MARQADLRFPSVAQAGAEEFQPVGAPSCGDVCEIGNGMTTVLQPLRKTLSGSQFFLYGGSVAIMLYVAITRVLPQSLSEGRDQAIYYSLPVVFELSFFVSWLACRALSAPWHGAGPETIGKGSAARALNLLPVLAGCAVAFVGGFFGSRSVGVILVVAALEGLWLKFGRVRALAAAEYLIAVALMMACFKSQALVNVKEAHHWSFYLGSLYAVLDGGKLLWDVPSQYGFLVLLVSAFVSQKLGLAGMDGFGLVMVILQAGFIGVLFYFLRMRARLSPILAAATTCCFALFFPGRFSELMGITSYPSVSAIRFFPALIALLCVERASRRQSVASIALATLATVAACTWSFESLVYSLGPLCAYVCLKTVLELDLSFARKAPFLPVALGLGLACALVLLYSLTIRPGSDLTGFYDFALQYADVHNTMPMQFEWFFVFYVFFLAFCYFFARLGLFSAEQRNIPAAMFFFYVWLVGSYYVARSHPNNILNISPWALFAMAACAPVVRGGGADWLHRASMIAVSVLFLDYAVVNSSAERAWAVFERATSPVFWSRPEFPAVPREVSDFMASHSNVTIVGNFTIVTPSEVLGHTDHYLTLSPVGFLTVLHPRRTCEYFERMVSYRGGSLVVSHPAADQALVPLLNLCPKGVRWKELSPVGGWRVFEVWSA